MHLLRILNGDESARFCITARLNYTSGLRADAGSACLNALKLSSKLFMPSLEQALQHWNTVVQKHPDNPNAYVQRGMVKFKLARILESIEDFDAAEKIEPAIAPYLWQRGLSYYYAERYQEGVQQFERDLKVNSRDVEETVWRYLCMAKMDGTRAARTALLVVKDDTRAVMRRVYDLFAGLCPPNSVLQLGQQEGLRGLFYSHLYVGLYYEAEADELQAQQLITQAAQYVLDDYMWHLACVHQTLRGWT